MLSHSRGLLTLGNGKVGDAIHLWSLPAVLSCPGRSPACAAACYARRGRYRFHAVRDRLHANYDRTRDPDFATTMSAEVRRRGCLVVRIHASGDFYSAAYTDCWSEIVASCPKTVFYAYTRSWRVGAVRPALERLAELSNARLWYSTDRDTGPVEFKPAGVRTCHLLTREGEDVAEGTDLVFRVVRLRRARVPLQTVCPSESPAGTARALACGACSKCFR